MTTATELKIRLLSKAEDDSEFRARLIADPNATIADEIGQPIPEGFEFVVHEDSATAAHLVLPPSPALTEAVLEGVAGGNTLGSGHPIGAPGEYA